MLIGIDGNEANVEKRVGISEYSFELLKKFEESHPSDGWIKFQIYLKNSPLIHMPRERDGWKYRVVHPSRLWTQIGLPLELYLNTQRPDVFFSPTHYAPRFSSIPLAISVMDLSYIYYPNMFRASDLYQLRHWTAYSIMQAKRIFTISEASKNDIINYYQINPDKVVVTYPGVKLKVQNSMQNTNVLKQKYAIDKEYILFVGTLQPRKNLVRLIEAFSKIALDTLDLVIIGKKGWLYDEIIKAPKIYGADQRVKFLDFVPNEDLPYFYENALCFVLPSLYEGFGLPVLEAMQYGCPVVISNVSSLPEVGGDAVLYVDPLNTNDIVEKISVIVGDKKLREKLKKLGKQQVKKFSWEKTAKQTLGVLKEVVHEG